MADTPLTKPFPTFPLTPHKSGRGWVKKYKGHQLFVRDRDPAAALARFHRLAKEIDEGRPRGKSVHPADATVYDVTNRYVIEREADRDAGKLSDGTVDDYRDAANAMCECFGDGALVDSLAPDDFTRLFRALDARLGAHAMARAVQACRTIFKHAYECAWVRTLPRYGATFKKPTTDKKAGAGFTLEEYRRLVAFAAAENVQLEAMLLLMANGGYTAKDCAVLPRAAVDLAAGLIRFPRPKMKRRRPVDRVMCLWPETAAALGEVMAARPADALVFRTSHGNPWVQGSTDSVRLLSQRLVKAAGWDVRGPSWLRHLHRTIADELEKPHAAARLMGHRLPGLAEVYVDTIEHERVRQITDHIRSRIWPFAPARPALPS